MSTPSVPDPRAEQEAHPIFQKFLVDRDKPEHCWYCSRPFTEPPWGPWLASFIKQKLTHQGKLQFGNYLQTHDADDQRRVIPPLTGMARPLAHHACFYINEECERYPQTVEELQAQWDEEGPLAIDADDDVDDDADDEAPS
jgi:hypothetical protein